MEEEFVQNQERLKPADERNEEERTKVGRGSRALLRAWRLQRAAGSRDGRCYVVVLQFIQQLKRCIAAHGWV